MKPLEEALAFLYAKLQSAIREEMRHPSVTIYKQGAHFLKVFAISTFLC